MNKNKEYHYSYVNHVLMLYIFQFGLLKKFLFLRWCVTCTHVRLPQDWRNIMLLILILLTFRIWWAPNNACKWQMGFNSAFKRLILRMKYGAILLYRHVLLSASWILSSRSVSHRAVFYTVHTNSQMKMAMRVDIWHHTVWYTGNDILFSFQGEDKRTTWHVCTFLPNNTVSRLRKL